MQKNPINDWRRRAGAQDAADLGGGRDAFFPLTTTLNMELCAEPFNDTPYSNSLRHQSLLLTMTAALYVLCYKCGSEYLLHAARDARSVSCS